MGELRRTMKDPDSQKVFEHFGMDVRYLQEVQDLLFTHTPEVPIETVMEMMLSCRTSLPTTFKHLSEGEYFTRLLMKDQIARVIEGVTALKEHIQLMMNDRWSSDANLYKS